jgi:hypothetical protein
LNSKIVIFEHLSPIAIITLLYVLGAAHFQFWSRL